MITDMKENLVEIVILDISGVYAQIHNQGCFDKKTIESIQLLCMYQLIWHLQGQQYLYQIHLYDCV